MNSAKDLINLGLVCAASAMTMGAHADNAKSGSEATVHVPSLAVAQRLRTIENINVTAEKARTPIEASSPAVEAILREAETTEAQTDEQAETTSEN